MAIERIMRTINKQVEGKSYRPKEGGFLDSMEMTASDFLMGISLGPDMGSDRIKCAYSLGTY